MEDFILSYETTLDTLYRMKDEILSLTPGKRDLARLACIEDEILDIEFALVEMRRYLKGSGYRPRRLTVIAKLGDFVNVFE